MRVDVTGYIQEKLRLWLPCVRLSHAVTFRLSSILAVAGRQERSEGQVGSEKSPEQVLSEAPHCQDTAQT